MKKTVLFTALTLFLALPLFSQSGKIEKIKKLFTLMQTDKMIDQVFDQMVSSSTQQMKAAANGDEAAKEAAVANFERMMTISRETAKLLVNDLSEVYAKYYTEEDVDVLIKFHESPTGKKTIEMQPKLVGEMMNLMNTKYAPMMQENSEK